MDFKENPQPGSHAGRILRVLLNGGALVADQSMFAVTNFVSGIILAGALSPESFGAFAVGTACFVFACGLHMACIVEPMLVFGAGRYHHNLRAYIRAVYDIHLLACGVIAALFALAGALFDWLGHGELAVAFYGVAVFSPPVLSLWLFRRGCHLSGTPKASLLGTSTYAALVIAGTLALAATGQLTVFTAALVSAGGAGVGCLVLHPWVASSRGEGVRLSRWSVAREQAQYCTWAAGNGILNWVLTNLPYLLLPIWRGLEDAAALRILSFLYMPIYQIISALSAFALPALSRARRQNAFPRLAATVIGLFMAFALAYSAAVCLFHTDILTLFLGQKYRIDDSVVWLFGAGAVLMAFAEGGFAALRALQRPDAAFSASALMSILLFLQWPLFPTYGIGGVGIAQIVCWTVGSATLVWLLRRTLAGDARTARPIASRIEVGDPP